MTVPILDLGDDARERGRAQGEALRADAKHNVAVYVDRFARLGLPTADLLDESARWLPELRRQDAEFAEEVEGIAEGADISVPEAVMLNVRYELIIGMLKRGGADPAGVDGCTSFGLLPERTASGTTVLGQNWDWVPGVRTYVSRVRRSGRPDFIGHAEAGTAAATQQGVNEHGVGVVINALMATADSTYTYEHPFRLRVRNILSAANLGEAIHAVTGTNRVVSMNFLIGHHLAEVVDIEAGPDTAAYQLPTDGILTHANHFAELAIESEVLRLWPTSVYRDARLRRLLEKHDRLDDHQIRKALSDPLLCVQPATDDPRTAATLNAVLIDLNRRSVAVTPGAPDTHEFEEHLLE